MFGIQLKEEQVVFGVDGAQELKVKTSKFSTELLLKLP